MLLAIDVGNTEITLGLFVGERLSSHWRVTTVTARTPDEWGALLTSFLTHAGHSTHEVRAAVEASVAPAVTEVLAQGITKAMGITPIQVGPESPLPIVLEVDEPHSVGADRVVNTLAAAELYRRDTIIVDFGTATTFDCITKDGKFLGGVIAPGIRTSAISLSRLAAKLPDTELLAPSRVIGKRTEECIRAGVVFGTADAVDGIVRRIKSEWPGTMVPHVVATGGLAATVAPHCTEIEAVEPNLTLVGLRIAARHLGLQW
ncbi:MAG: type III pantothenate kinase [Gemmatimonadota bacterium]|nr:type III pantothenate kinase [Gemmatimonadota bacterium]MDH3477191.1 type III pantothenate kinase [Gemmatimonadota bacterium]MDH3569643.1 type III pantothenate kinase [Gemmatimonadota bacterium]MDH5550191.1 type III pantothenate kinase [Gemmatimonadota bacterium]